MLKNLLGFIWSLPVSIPTWLLIFVLKVSKQIDSFLVTNDFLFLVDLKNDGWFCKKFFTDRGWAGFSFGNCIFVVDSDTERWKRTVKHESVHCHQTYKYGVFNIFVYLGWYLYLYWFTKDKHPYYDHPAEREAREKAGQRVDIPKEDWGKDRWIFW